MKSYIKFLLKKYLPFYVVLFAVCISFFFTFLTTDNNVYYHHIETDYYIQQPSSLLLAFIIPLAIVSIFAPIFANTYRYSIKSVDVFYQTGKGSREVRIMNNITLLVMILISYTAAFLIAMAIMFFKQLPNAGRVVVQDEFETRYILFNFGYYFLAYLLAVIICVVNYFISYFLITRANNPFNSILCLVLGHLILSVLLYTPVWYISIIQSLFKFGSSVYNMNILILSRVPSIIGPIALIANLFETLIVSGQPLELVITADDISSIVLTVVSMVIFFAVGGFAIYRFFKEKESSGELAGKPEGRDKFQMIIYHTGAGLIGFWYGIANGFISSLLLVNVLTTVSSFIMFCALYYVFYGVIRRNFKLKKKDFAILIPIASIYIVSAVLYNIFSGLANAA